MTAQTEIDISPDGQLISVQPTGSKPLTIDNSKPLPQMANSFAPLLSHLERGRPLPEGWEARDDLLDVIEEDGYCIAVFKFGNIRLPADLAPRLQDLIGKKVGLLNLGEYKLRAL